MNVEYQHIEANNRGYNGVSFSQETCVAQLSGSVKDNLLDQEERDVQLESLRALEADTGFSSDNLLADIQALENNQVDLQTFRIGEAFAEVVLEEEFQCRFHWNELRDARNPKGNKTGADLVGFIEVNGDVLFLFGEVKTSSETATIPPQVMTGGHGIESQLTDLYTSNTKRRILISYLQNKVRLLQDGHPFKVDFDSSIRNYYSETGGYHLIGVLVRDVTPDEADLSGSYDRLKNAVLDPIGIQLLALYTPMPKEDWLSIVNEPEES